MRLRTVMFVFLAMNVVWAAALFGFIQRARQAPVVRVDAAWETNRTASAATNSARGSVATNNAATLNSAKPPTNSPAAVVANDPKPAPANKKFTWQNVQSDEYLKYIEQLRAVGCPEPRVRTIISADVNELFDKKRLEAAVAADMQWWRAESAFGFSLMPLAPQNNFQEERRTILTKLLGENWDETEKLPPFIAGVVHLTGPVLGALPQETHNTVQDICARASERHNSYQMTRFNEQQPLEQVELAKLRNQTRTDLARVISPEELGEFLLRFSQNSSNLRRDLRGFEVTPDEFRKIFRSLDPIEHQMQLEYGGPEALSPKQREQHERQRDRVIQEVLSPERYQAYLETKNPLYRSAQLMATQYGMNGRAVQPIFLMQQNAEKKRLAIAADPALTPEQKIAAQQALALEQQRTLQRMMNEATYRR